MGKINADGGCKDLMHIRCNSNRLICSSYNVPKRSQLKSCECSFVIIIILDAWCINLPHTTLFRRGTDCRLSLASCVLCFTTSTSVRISKDITYSMQQQNLNCSAMTGCQPRSFTCGHGIIANICILCALLYHLHFSSNRSWGER